MPERHLLSPLLSSWVSDDITSIFIILPYHNLCSCFRKVVLLLSAEPLLCWGHSVRPRTHGMKQTHSLHSWNLLSGGRHYWRYTQRIIFEGQKSLKLLLLSFRKSDSLSSRCLLSLPGTGTGRSANILPALFLLLRILVVYLYASSVSFHPSSPATASLVRKQSLPSLWAHFLCIVSFSSTWGSVLRIAGLPACLSGAG